MSNDEQTIYISPEDDLTNVRERLESLPSRRITLVIPRQTMLRSHVAWRNLYARAKELEKDVLIISADAQIRSLAQAAKFRVAHSLESSPTGKSRLGMNRPVRSNPASRMRSTQLRPSTGRAASSESETLQRANRPERNEPPDAAIQPQSKSRTTRGSNSPSTYQGPESTMPRTNEITTGGLHDPGATYDLTGNSYGQVYDYKIDTPPFKPQPLSPQHFEEEPDLLDEDYRKTLDIHQSVVEGKQHTIDVKPPTPTAPTTPTPGEPEQPYRIVPLPPPEEDPFFYMEDDALPPLPRSEQHGEVSVDGFDTAEQPVHDISEMPTDVIHHDIEYQGDLGDFVHPENGPDFVRNWMDSLPEDDQDMAGPSGASRAYGVRPRSSRTGKTAPPSTTRRTNELEMPTPIEDRPTLTPQSRQAAAPPPQQKSATTGPRFTPTEEPSMPAASIIPLPATKGTRPSQKLPTQGQGNKPVPMPAPQTVQRAGTNRAGGNRNGGPGTKSRVGAAPTSKTVRGARPARQAQRRQGLRGGAVFVAFILLFFIILGLIAFVYPTADVTITVASRDFSAPVTVLASTQSTGKPGSVLATSLAQTFPRTGGALTGTGSVSGSANIGTAKATGTVIFTNNGTASVDIPTGTVIQTAQGIQFATTADVLVTTGANNSIPAPVQAQQQGESGNVPAGSITVIPQSSLTTIAAQTGNPPLTSIKLSVNNDNALSGGGVGTAAVVAQSDIDKVKQSLRSQLQADIATWEKQQVHQGDVAGSPTTTEALVDAPKVGQTVDNGSFTMGLKLTVTMLVVRNADIQKAAITSLNDTLSKSKQPSNANYHVADDANNPVVVQNLKTTQATNGLTLAFTAKGKIVPNIATSQAQQLIVGKFKTEAKTAITQSIQNVQKVDIKTNPGFYPLIPYLTKNITIHLVPGTTQK